METKETLDPVGAIAPQGAEPVMLGPDVVIEQLRALSRQIPEFGHLPPQTRLAMRTVAAADPAFVQSGIAAVGASEVVQQALGATPEELRVDSEAADRWTAVEAEARALFEGVRAANLTRRHRVGLAALRTYNISRQLVRGDEHGELLPHLAEMKRTNRFGRRRVRKADPAPSPSPGPVPAPQHPPVT